MKNDSIAILGACGAAGEVVLRLLAEHTANPIKIADINIEKATNLAGQLRKNIQAVHLDVFNEAQLRDVCQTSGIVVNCAGPTFKIKGIVGMIAMQEKSDYIEIGGYDYTDKEMRDEINRHSGQSYVISAGWGPGISDFLPYYSDIKAGEILDEKECLQLFFGDRGRWSDTGLLDIVKLTKKNKAYPMSIFKDGKLQKVVNAFKKADLPFGLIQERACINMIPEIEYFSLSHLYYREIKSYGILFGWKTYFTFMLIGFLLRSEKKCMQVLKRAFKHEVDSKGARGVAVVEVRGKKDGKEKSLWTKIESNDGYFMTGAGCAATVLCLLKQKVKKGFGLMSGSVDVQEYSKILKMIGIDIKEIIV